MSTKIIIITLAGNLDRIIVITEIWDQTIALMIEHIIACFINLLQLPQVPPAPFFRPRTECAFPQSGFAHSTRRVGFEIVEYFLRLTRGTYHDVNVISADINRAQSLAAVDANLTDGLINHNPTRFIKVDRNLFEPLLFLLLPPIVALDEGRPVKVV